MQHEQRGDAQDATRPKRGQELVQCLWAGDGDGEGKATIVSMESMKLSHNLLTGTHRKVEFFVGYSRHTKVEFFVGYF